MSAVSIADCDPLEVLFEGSTGTCYLGVITSGPHAGRPALLRPLPEPELTKVSAILPVLQVLSRPSSTKILCLATSEGTSFVASEYIEGASLLELELAASARGEKLPTPVVTRVIREALLAAHSSQAMLSDTGGFTLICTLSAESIWVAAYGEVYLTELGVIAGLLASAPPRPGAPARGLEPNPVRAAGAELSRLLLRERTSRTPDTARPSLPATIPSIVDMALSTQSGHRFSGPATMVEALCLLPVELVADSRQLASEMSRLVGDKLLKRKALAVVPAATSSIRQPVGENTRQYDVREMRDTFKAALTRGIARDRAARFREGTPAIPGHRADDSAAPPELLCDAGEEEETRHYDLVDGGVPSVARAFATDLAQEELTKHYDPETVVAALDAPAAALRDLARGEANGLGSTAGLEGGIQANASPIAEPSPPEPIRDLEAFEAPAVRSRAPVVSAPSVQRRRSESALRGSSTRRDAPVQEARLRPRTVLFWAFSLLAIVVGVAVTMAAGWF